mgnify:CR=1 FL=1
MLNEIKRLLKNELKEIKNDDQPNSLKDKYINEGIIEGIEIANKVINVVSKNHYNTINNELSSTLECEKESYDNGGETDENTKGWIEALEYTIDVVANHYKNTK